MAETVTTKTETSSNWQAVEPKHALVAYMAGVLLGMLVEILQKL